MSDSMHIWFASDSSSADGAAQSLVALLSRDVSICTWGAGLPWAATGPGGGWLMMTTGT